MLQRALFEFVGIETDDDLQAAMDVVTDAGLEVAQFSMAPETFDAMTELRDAQIILDEYMPVGKVLIAHRSRPRQIH